MQTTLPKLKKKIIATSGVKMSKDHPYWMRANEIKMLESALEEVRACGEEEPSKYFSMTARQYERLQDWIADTKAKYL